MAKAKKPKKSTNATAKAPAANKKPTAKKKPTVKKTVAKKPTTKKAATKKPPAKTPAAKKTTKKTVTTKSGGPQQSPAVAARGSPASPRIINPAAGAVVAPGVNLSVNMYTNRGDLRYVLVLTDTNPPPGPVQHNLPAPGGSGFSDSFAGANLQANRTYTIRVSVDPSDGATPPHGAHSITITTGP